MHPPLSTAASLLMVSATLQAQSMLQVDFGISGSGQTTTAAGWNNMTADTAGPNPGNLNGLVDSTGEVTGISLAYSESGGNAGVSGTAANYEGPWPGAVGALPATALKDGLYYQAGVEITLTLSGLDPALHYDVLLYGARGNNGGDAVYTVNGANSGSGSIADVFNNRTEAVAVSAITPNPGGVIDLVLSQGPSPAGAGSINLMVVTASQASDTDEDGMTDTYETANGTDPEFKDAGLDKDSDGLSNIQEFLGHNASDAPTGYGQTLSGTADSDGDGINDLQELTGTLNPWTDGVLGSPPGDPTNPNDPDSDDDGVGDGSEITSGSDPNAKPPNSGPTFPFVDTDGDSYRDGAEIAFGSDPNDPASCPDHTPASAKPNVVIIYADDMGFGDMSAYGGLFGTPSPADTPRMDALAAQGVLFTQAHSSNGVCTPSRYALLTGKYNWRLFSGITDEYGWATGAGRSEVPLLSDTTIAEYLKSKGYDTAAFGKWHLGGNWYYRNGNTRVTGNPNTPSTIDWARPVENHAVAHGFDLFRGLACTINRGPYLYLENDRNQFWDASLHGGAGGFRNATNSDPIQWLTNIGAGVVAGPANTPSLGDPSYRQIDAGPLMITQVEQYLADRAASADPDPFLAYVALYSPHQPWAITPEFNTSSNHYADFMREVDSRIGRVLDAIDHNGFHDNTLVILTSDNGPETTAMSASLPFGKDPNGPLRGVKRDAWDGGTRVPFVVRWPGQAAAGMKTGELIWQGDIFATLAAFLHDELPAEVAPDGESFLNIIRGQRKPAPQRNSVVVSSINGHLGLKTTDGWKLVDSTGGGGNSTTWNSSNATISNAIGTSQGTPKQLFQQSVDLGEDDNLIAGLTNPTAIRNELVSLTGMDLLSTLDQYRATTTSILHPRSADNDADGLPNAYELQSGLDPDSPKDAAADLDGDGSSNRDEFITGTSPTDPRDYFRVIDLHDGTDDIEITWASVSGRSYTVTWSTDLGIWTADSIHPGTGAHIRVSIDKTAIDNADGIPGNLASLFVRVEVALP